MSKVELKSDVKVEFQINLKLSLEEALALETMTRYGHKAFLEGYYKHLGKSYMQPHEKGLISLFTTINTELPQHIRTAKIVIQETDKLRNV